MIDASPSPPSHEHPIGELLVGGDWACAHGDAETLAYVAQQLASCVAEPYHGQLAEVARLAHTDPGLATAAWARVREVIRERVCAPVRSWPV